MKFTDLQPGKFILLVYGMYSLYREPLLFLAHTYSTVVDIVGPSSSVVVTTANYPSSSLSSSATIVVQDDRSFNSSFQTEGMS